MKPAPFLRQTLAGLRAMGVLAFLAMLAANPALGAPASKNVKFDHARTGFNLTGAHVRQPCETCHVQGVFKGTPKHCVGCHTPGSRIATQTFKSSTHVRTQEACERCHSSTASWKVARFDHVGVKVNQCRTCHAGGSTDVTKSPGDATHANMLPCDACHRTTTWTTSSALAHMSRNGLNCLDCHRNTPKPSNHPVITGAQQCSDCHSITSWRGVTGGALPTNHRPVLAGNACSTCHAPGSYNFVHPSRTSGCVSCHNGTYARNRVNAIHTNAGTNVCETCHRSTGPGGFATYTFSHNFVATSGCNSCHNGSNLPAVGRPTTATHPVTAASCDSCHSRTAWLPANSNVLPPNHRPVLAGNPCSTCHLAGSNNFTHPTRTTGCASCHNGSYARNRVNAIHTNAGTTACETCHRSTAPGGFATFTFSHTFVTANGCNNCHNGSNPPAVGRPNTATHPVTAASCDSCHSRTAWRPATSNVLPPNHRPVLGGTACTTCHNPGSYTFVHNATTNCASCHNGSYARNRVNAIHTNAGTTACETCHRSTAPGGFRTWTFSHTFVSPTGCATCHNGSNPPARGKPANHIPYETQLLTGASMSCNACHRSTTTFAAQMNHNGSQGNGSGWCKGCHTSGTSYLGRMEKKSLTHERSTGVTDCSQSGCHRPLGNRGTAYSKW